ncbi:TraM recognition domain-containing protein [Alicyclobacillus mali]|uniref:TraM recognition domain-containing protein n=1 Tax=Alicyclobacillus mali (ex Roth et al. 2021) TaxID=1123961 RepID=A0ABS0EZJ6_9BACL|nr:TraM recognition domain-containing protein [Alicyclobacillus mali (ex Roth et al. 2021)]MBF8376463.1 TraM recognition domain-containing protein [Alicyclobacillus mali (ex Roth et al. 2021)]
MPAVPALVRVSIAHSTWFMVVIGAIGAFALYRTVFRALGRMAQLGALAVIGMGAFGVAKLHGLIAAWQTRMLHPSAPKASATATNSSAIINPLTSGTGPKLPVSALNATNPLVHENAWVIALALVVGVLGVLAAFAYRGLSPTAKAQLMQRMQASDFDRKSRRRDDDPNKFPLVGVEVGIRKDNGRPIRIEGKDRFINTLVLGSTGTGKTSRIMLKAVYQDLRSIANGTPMDVIAMDPDGGFAQAAVNMANQFGVETIIMDLRGTMPSTVSFSPFGGDIADIIDNVRAALQEKMGKQDGFFQNAQDDLVRTVIQVQVPLWPEADFLQFADLVTDPLHFRAICSMVQDCAAQEAGTAKKKRKNEMDEAMSMWEHERPEVEARFHRLTPHEKSMVLSAARSFLMDTATEQKLEKLETITKGLKIVVNELATNPRLRQVFKTDELSPFDFQGFLAAGKDKPGRLVVVVTGNRPAGKLFGKLFLVTLKMYALERGGTEDTRRPVYLYVDEFAVYGTESFTEMFSQARKYRVGMMLAIQARAQLLDVSKKFMDVVEGSCRNKIYFPAPSPDDARFLEHALGSVKNIRETYSENKLSWFFDTRNLDRRVSTQETIDPRYRLEDIAYGLSKDEAIFAMTVDNQVQTPCVGITSYADEWVKQRRGFFDVRRRQNVLTKRPTPVGAVAEDVIPVESKDKPLRESGDQVTVNSPESQSRVRPTADRNAKIDVQAFTRAIQQAAFHTPESPHAESSRFTQDETQEATSAEKDEAAPSAPSNGKIASDAETPVDEQPAIVRIDLRAQRPPKRCPQCEDAELVLTPDARKWRCPQCGFERKNR